MAPKCPLDGVHRVEGPGFLYRCPTCSHALVCLVVARPNITVPLFSPHKRDIIRMFLISSSLSAHSSCFIPPHCNHTTLKEVPKHFPCSIVAHKVLVALLLVAIPPISSVLHPVKDPRVSTAPMLSVWEATNATSRQLEQAGTCPRDLVCLLSRQKTRTSQPTPEALCHLLALFLALT